MQKQLCAQRSDKVTTLLYGLAGPGRSPLRWIVDNASVVSGHSVTLSRWLESSQSVSQSVWAGIGMGMSIEHEEGSLRLRACPPIPFPPLPSLPLLFSPAPHPPNPAQGNHIHIHTHFTHSSGSITSACFPCLVSSLSPCSTEGGQRTVTGQAASWGLNGLTAMPNQRIRGGHGQEGRAPLARGPAGRFVWPPLSAGWYHTSLTQPSINITTPPPTPPPPPTNL